MNNLGIIAGSGDFPILVAKGARCCGVKQIVVTALVGETKREIELVADVVVWIELNQLEEMIHCFKTNGCDSVVMAGQIAPTKLFSHLKLDLRLVDSITEVKYKGAGPYFSRIAEKLAEDKINIIDSTTFVKDHLAEAGLMTKNKISANLEKTIQKDYALVKELSELGLAKTVVMKDGSIVAIEAIEGTNETIKRAGELAGTDTIVYKISNSKNKNNVSIPVVGIETLKIMKEFSASVLVVDKFATIILNLKDVIKYSEENNITIIGM